MLSVVTTRKTVSHPVGGIDVLETDKPAGNNHKSFARYSTISHLSHHTGRQRRGRGGRAHRGAIEETGPVFASVRDIARIFRGFT